MKTPLALFLLITAGTMWAEKGTQAPTTGPAGLAADIALYRHFGPRMAAARAGGSKAVFTDVGNIAVMEDDGTLVLPPNAFDLDTKSILFTRNSDGTYQVKASSGGFDQSAVDAGKI